jgi:primosomal protein N' (replication factor Y)
VTPRVVRVLPDVPAINKTFDYLVPDAVGNQVRVGTRVRIQLHGRRVGGWVVADHVDPPAGVTLRPLAKVSGWGPEPELIEVASWAAWRWAGRPASLLATASPDTVVTGLPRLPPPAVVPTTAVVDEVAALAAEALDLPTSVLRLPPAIDPFAVVLHAARTATERGGDALVLVPTSAQARHLALRLRRSGVATALLPRDWAAARAGRAVVVGSRAAAWAPMPRLGAVVVLDEHDEVYAEERAPTWHARDVVAERARRTQVPCTVVSPLPTLEAHAWGRLVVPSRALERAGWPKVDVIDRRRDDAVRSGLYSARLVDLVRSGARVVCVLNRTGRSRLLVCASCAAVAVCEHCNAAVGQDDNGQLRCHRCGTTRPVVCQSCGAIKLKNVRAGVSRVREELEALANAPVVEVTASTSADDRERLRGARLVVGTEAVLHDVDDADVVAFLDFDQELLAPRYRAAEQALGLLARAARLVGGREGSGRVVVQTRLPSHEVVQAALLGDPARVAQAERDRRALLRFPPFAALAEVSGASAQAFIDAFGLPVGVEVLGPTDGRWMLRAPDHQVLCDALAATPRPGGRLRVEVDPLRI